LGLRAVQFLVFDKCSRNCTAAEDVRAPSWLRFLFYCGNGADNKAYETESHFSTWDRLSTHVGWRGALRDCYVSNPQFGFCIWKHNVRPGAFDALDFTKTGGHAKSELLARFALRRLDSNL